MKTSYEIAKMKRENIWILKKLKENVKKIHRSRFNSVRGCLLWLKLWKSNIHPAGPEPEKWLATLEERRGQNCHLNRRGSILLITEWSLPSTRSQWGQLTNEFCLSKLQLQRGTCLLSQHLKLLFYREWILLDQQWTLHPFVLDRYC